MQTPNWFEWKCRCSSISKILTNASESKPITEIQLKRLKELDEKPLRTEKQSIELTELIQKRENSKVVKLGDTCIQYLLEAYSWETERMVSITKELDVEAFERGRKTEPESIKLLSEVDKVEYYKNETRFDNDFLTGIPDLLVLRQLADPSEVAVERIREIKSCRDHPLFLYKIHKGLDPGNAEQLRGYGDILECDDLAVAFTLPNMPEEQRLKKKYQLADRMGEVTMESPKFLKTWTEIEHSMIFSHMPASKRVYKIPVKPFTPFEKQAVYDRVKLCREWLTDFDTRYKQLNS